MAPDNAPSSAGLPFTAHSANIQDNAAAAVATEALLALLLLGFLARAGADVVPRLGFLPRPLLAGVAGALVALLPLSPWLVAPLAAAAYLAVAFAAGAVPPEVVPALRGRKPE